MNVFSVNKVLNFGKQSTYVQRYIKNLPTQYNLFILLNMFDFFENQISIRKKEFG